MIVANCNYSMDALSLACLMLFLLVPPCSTSYRSPYLTSLFSLTVFRTSSIAVKLATKHLSESGVLALSGAMPCLEGTPGMMGYGMAKAAVHQLTYSLADPAKAGLPASSVAVAILPVCGKRRNHICARLASP